MKETPISKDAQRLIESIESPTKRRKLKHELKMAFMLGETKGMERMKRALGGAKV